MREHMVNALYGVADYVAQPVGMLLAAPVLLHRLGLASYGIWLIATAAISAGSIISSGFGDAAIQRIAALRVTNDQPLMGEIVSSILTINIALGAVLCALLWLLSSVVSRHITQTTPSLYFACVWSLRMGALLIVIKSIESVFISAQRAFESYATAVRINTATRLLTLAVSVAVVLAGHALITMMFTTLVISVIGAGAQSIALRKHISGAGFKPRINQELLGSLASFGGYSWLQAICGVIFSQADRLLIGTTLGASAVACYGICVQVAQPIHGITAAALHFLFPHLAARSAHLPVLRLRGLVNRILTANLILATALTCLVASIGSRVIHAWIGNPVAAGASALLPLIALGFGFLAMNVTGHYALLAFGDVKTVTALNLAGGCAMLVAISLLWRTHGIHGAAIARLCYGPITLLMYVPLLRRLYPMALTGSPERVITEDAS